MSQPRTHPVSVFGASHSYRSGTFIDWHDHTDDQIAHAISGVMRIYARDCLWLVPPGRALWIPRGTSHAIQCCGEVEMRSLHVNRLLVPTPGGLEVWQVSALMRELMVKLCADPPDRQRAALARLVEMEIEVCRTQPLSLPQARHRGLRALCLEMIANRGDRRTLDEVARALSMSPRTFVRLFRRETGMTFRAWRLQVRLLCAIELFSQGTSISTASHLAGYSTPSAFSAAFKAAFGTQPSRYA